MSYFFDWFDPEETAGLDEVAPVITLVSPEEFDGDFAVATVTPIIITVTDADPGLGLVTILVSGAGFSGTQLVYANGAFVSPFTASTASNITNGTTFSFKPAGGWEAGELEVTVIAMDGNGNMATYTNTWTVVPAEASSFNGAAPFRDSVWRWRRRLARQKCSVISVAIEDDYSDGPGFTLTALALELAKKPGLDRIPWRDGTYTIPSGSGTNSDGM